MSFKMKEKKEYNLPDGYYRPNINYDGNRNKINVMKISMYVC